MNAPVRAIYGTRRYLASLKWSGIVPNKHGMLVVPAGTPAMVVREVEALCALDEQFDWCFAADKEPAQ